jgi:transposase-like protein
MKKAKRPKFTAEQRQELVQAIYNGVAVNAVSAMDLLKTIDANTNFRV